MWALDLGTTNSLLARWDLAADRPALLELPALARRATRAGAEQAIRAVPSAVQILEAPSFWARHFSLGKLAMIGRPALEANAVRQRPGFAPSFKRALSMSPLSTLARVNGKPYAAREVGFLFLRELLHEARRVSGQRVRELVVTSPIDAFETYRAEVSGILKRLGVRRVRYLDEPVAAALGYGLGLRRDRRLLVVDFGGGTLHVAVVKVGAAEASSGRAEVLAKASRDLGGNLVDQWLLEECFRRLHYDVEREPDDEAKLWQALMAAEACRVKEAIYFDERATFELTPPENLKRFEARLHGEARSLEIDRAELVRLLTAHGLYQALEACLEEALSQAKARGAGEADIEEVLMIGGSSLLPDVYPLFERRFGRNKVRAWQPFEAVVFGAGVFAADRATPADFIVHDYALMTHDRRTQEAEYTVVIPRGTPFPTAPDIWKRQLVPTCALGEPEKVFKLVICEIGSGRTGAYVWDAEGRLHRSEQARAEQVVVKLNERNPALGTLDPPHSPRDQAPRLEISFGVNAERWLCATVVDLKSSRPLLRNEPVVRLL